MNETSKAALAFTGETLATDFLSNSGYRILSRNVHSVYGEIDIIALDSDEIVFIEVKTRSGHALKNAENSINPAKQRKLTLTAMKYISDHPQYANHSCRFDVVIVLYFAQDETYSIKHQKNAFLPVVIDNNSS